LSLLEPNGLFVYAVFNPEFIRDHVSKQVFSGFAENPSGCLELKPRVKVRCFNRAAAEYRYICENLRFEGVYLDYPDFTEEFLAKYKMPFSTQYSEYLIQAFRRKSK
jgi:hypothetical protein